MSEYQIFVTCEFSDWIGKLRGSGLDVKSTVNVDFQKEMPIDARIDAIKQILEGGRVLAKMLFKLPSQFMKLLDLYMTRIFQRKAGQ